MLRTLGSCSDSGLSSSGQGGGRRGSVKTAVAKGKRGGEGEGDVKRD